MEYHLAAQELHDLLEVPYADYCTIEGIYPLIRSRHRIIDASAAALSVLGSTISIMWQKRTGKTTRASVDLQGSLYQLMAWLSTTCSGLQVRTYYPEDKNLLGNNDFYPTADGRPIFLITTYPALRDIICDILDSPPCKERMAEKTLQWNSFELEERVLSQGGCAAAARTRIEWLNHPIGQILDKEPLIKIEKIADGLPIPFPEFNDETNFTALSGIKFLDNTHVIAGPVSTRFAAELGAKVLHISSPQHPDPNAMIIDTGIGKRCSFVDLTTELGRKSFWKLFNQADVFVNSYLSLSQFGVNQETIIENSSGIVVLDFLAWGKQSPWSNYGGFDQLACTATGFAVGEGSMIKPKLPATWLLNDYLASIIGLAGALKALQLREEYGGSYRVHMDLAKICMWVQDLGVQDNKNILSLPDPVPKKTNLNKINSVFGPIDYLPLQILFDDFTFCHINGPEPLGSSVSQWW